MPRLIVARCSPQKCSRPCGAADRGREARDLPGPKIGPGAGRVGSAPHECKPISSSWPFAAGRSVSMAAITARPASAGGKRSSAAAVSPVIHAVRLVTSARIVAIARGGEHAGARIGEQARRVAILLPEPAARREIDLRQRLRRQRRDGGGLRGGQLRLDRDSPQHAGGHGRDDVARRERAAVRARDDGAVALERDGRDGAAELDASARAPRPSLREFAARRAAP